MPTFNTQFNASWAYYFKEFTTTGVTNPITLNMSGGTNLASRLLVQAPRLCRERNETAFIQVQVPPKQEECYRNSELHGRNRQVPLQLQLLQRLTVILFRAVGQQDLVLKYLMKMEAKLFLVPLTLLGIYCGWNIQCAGSHRNYSNNSSIPCKWYNCRTCWKHRR